MVVLVLAGHTGNTVPYDGRAAGSLNPFSLEEETKKLVMALGSC